MGNKSSKSVTPGKAPLKCNVTYELIYFDIRGRAESSRILFTMAGVKFTDNRISYAEWPQLKAGTPFGQLPVLKITGSDMKTPLILHQAHAIERYLAREFGFMGHTNTEQVSIEVILETVLDAIVPIKQIFNEKDDSKKAEVLKEYSTDLLPRFISYLTEKLGDKNWFVNKVSLADVFAYTALENICLFLPDVLMADSADKLRQWKQQFESIPSVEKYLKERPPGM